MQWIISQDRIEALLNDINKIPPYNQRDKSELEQAITAVRMTHNLPLFWVAPAAYIPSLHIADTAELVVCKLGVRYPKHLLGKIRMDLLVIARYMEAKDILQEPGEAPHTIHTQHAVSMNPSFPMSDNMFHRTIEFYSPPNGHVINLWCHAGNIILVVESEWPWTFLAKETMILHKDKQPPGSSWGPFTPSNTIHFDKMIYVSPPKRFHV